MRYFTVTLHNGISREIRYVTKKIKYNTKDAAYLILARHQAVVSGGLLSDITIISSTI